MADRKPLKIEDPAILRDLLSSLAPLSIEKPQVYKDAAEQEQFKAQGPDLDRPLSQAEDEAIYAAAHGGPPRAMPTSINSIDLNKEEKLTPAQKSEAEQYIQSLVDGGVLEGPGLSLSAGEKLKRNVSHLKADHAATNAGFEAGIANALLTLLADRRATDAGVAEGAGEVAKRIFTGEGLKKAQQVSPNLTNVFPRSETNLARPEVPEKIARAATYEPPLAKPYINPFAGGPPESTAEVVPSDIESLPKEGVPPMHAANEDPFSALGELFQSLSAGKPATDAAKPTKGGGSGPRRSGSGSGNGGVKDLQLEKLPGGIDAGADEQIKSQQAMKSELAEAAKLLQGKADAPASTAEVIGQLLVGLLPGLLGTAIGGAVGGTSGALAGAGGGFSGSAAGLNQANQVKREEKDKLTARAQKLQDRMDELERQISVRRDRLEDRSLTEKQAAAQRNQMKELQNQRNHVEMQMQASSQAHQSREHAKDLAMQAEQIAQRDRDSARDALIKLATEKAKAANSAGNRKEADMYTQASTAVDQLNALETAVKKTGGAESDSQFAFFSDKKAAADLKTAIENFAIAYAKLVDPDSVARPEEVKNAKEMIPMGWFTSQDATMEGIKNMRAIIRQKMEERATKFSQPVPDKALSGPAPGTNVWQRASGNQDLWSEGKPAQ